MATPSTHLAPVAVKLVPELIHTVRKPEEDVLLLMPAYSLMWLMSSYEPSSCSHAMIHGP